MVVTSSSEWGGHLFLTNDTKCVIFRNYSFPWVFFPFFWAVLALHVSGLGGCFLTTGRRRYVE